MLHDNYLSILDGSYNFKMTIDEVFETLMWLGLNLAKNNTHVKFIINKQYYEKSKKYINKEIDMDGSFFLLPETSYINGNYYDVQYNQGSILSLYSSPGHEFLMKIENSSIGIIKITWLK